MASKQERQREYNEIFREPEASTRFKAYYYGLDVDGYIFLVIEIHILEKMAMAGLLNRRQWHERFLRIHNEASFIGGIKRPERLWVFDVAKPESKEGKYLQ